MPLLHRHLAVLAATGAVAAHTSQTPSAFALKDPTPTAMAASSVQNTSGSTPQSGDVHLIAIDEARALPGATRALRHVVLSTPFDTRVSGLRVEEGQRVAAGDTIAVLDDRVAQATLRIARLAATNTATVARALARTKEARANLANIERARVAGAATPDELTDARTTVTVAETELRLAKHEHERAQLELDLAQARLEEHIVRAPFDAVVLRVSAEPGQVLSPGDSVAELATTGQPCVDLYLPSRTVLSMREGQAYALHVGQPLDVVLPAAVRYIEPRIDPTSQTQRVVFEFDARFSELPIGLIVEPATRIPAEADIKAAAGDPGPQRVTSANPSLR